MNRDAIVRDWLDEVFAAYPGETSRFLERERDPFRNPVGRAYREGLSLLVDVVLASGDLAPARTALDELIRIRAVQGIDHADAAGFIRRLKSCVRRHQRAPGDVTSGEPDCLAAIDRRIDALAALAAELDQQCRAQIAEMKKRPRTA